MRLLKILLLVAAAGLAFQLWQKHQSKQVVAALSRSASVNGFVPLPAPAGVDPKRVILFAPEYCTSEAARRTDDLARGLADRGIPCARSQTANFEFIDPDPAVVKSVDVVMNGDVPIVFVGGRAKANPTLAEVIAEYEATR